MLFSQRLSRRTAGRAGKNRCAGRRLRLERLEERRVLSGGVVTTSISSDDHAMASFLDSDQNIVVAGGAGTDFAVLRYKPDGTLDPAFGQGGGVITNVGSRWYAEAALATVADPFGRILTAGYSDATSQESNFALARYLHDGTLDTQFDRDGKVLTDLGQSDGITDVVIQPDGKIVVARYMGDGTLDTSFGKAGVVIPDPEPNDVYNLDCAEAVAVQPDGKIVVAGDAGSTLPQFGVARFNEDGTLDSTFGQSLSGGTGQDGIAVTRIATYAWVRSMVIQSDGNIVVSGYAYNGSRHVIALARYTPDGSLDATFGPAPTLAIGDVSKAEGNSGTTAFAFTVTLSSVSGTAVTVQYATANGTATAGSDYLATSGILTIPAGALSATITISVTGDTVKEANETFFVNLSNASGATIADSQGLGTITNDDTKTRGASLSAAPSSKLLAAAAATASPRNLRAADEVFLDLALPNQRHKGRNGTASAIDLWYDQ